MFPMGSLYVGDLHPDVTEAMLYDKFSSAGQVLSLRICRDFRTKQSLSYGYVNFNSPRDAETALDTMNFDHLKGKPIRIMWCQRDPSLRKSGVGNVFIKNLDKNIDNKAMYDTFSAFGSILSCKVALDEDGYSKGYGFVHFESEDIANRAIEKVNGMLLNEKRVYVGKFIPRSEREKKLGDRVKQFTNIYVKNFGQHMLDEEFYGIFSKFGTVTSSMVARNQDGTSKGFGFVAFEDANSAEKAAREMNGKEYDNRTLYVGRAQKKSERMNELRKKYEQQRMERFNKFQGLNLYIKNLDDSFTDDKLKAEFECFGKITSAKVMTENGRSRGFGFVCFSATEEANKAIHNMNAKIVGTKPLYVALAQRKEARRAFLTSQYVARAHAARQQGLQLPGGPPFLLPAVAQGPRIFGPAPALRAAPRWPSLQPLSRPNGASFELPLLGAAPFRAPSRPASIRVHARPITGVTVHTARPNSKYTTRHGPETFIADSRIVHAAPQEQKQLLGEQLFRIVEKLHPELAGKITGMLLEIDNSELVHMIKNQESLMAKVEEAIAVLEAHKVNKKGITVQDKA
ncbi:embryonic polyadenylate-binding protein-like isoform X1 [Euwallacea fornicatus]|uniref:embryonic polyadenylate-binding protein-like isoform X1 n=2 Tax=Euwallacea fornicatus TaxID=995702 RepID=UPI0033901EC8